mgnify:CR=1 FL=1
MIRAQCGEIVLLIRTGPCLQQHEFISVDCFGEPRRNRIATDIPIVRQWLGRQSWLDVAEKRLRVENEPLRLFHFPSGRNRELQICEMREQRKLRQTRVQDFRRDAEEFDAQPMTLRVGGSKSRLPGANRIGKFASAGDEDMQCGRLLAQPLPQVAG